MLCRVPGSRKLIQHPQAEWRRRLENGKSARSIARDFNCHLSIVARLRLLRPDRFSVTVRGCGAHQGTESAIPQQAVTTTGRAAGVS